MEAEDPAVQARHLNNLSLRLADMGDGPGGLQAIRVTVSDLPAPFQALNGTTLWVGPPREVSALPGRNDETPPTITVATLRCEPFFGAWADTDEVNVYHDAIIPGGRYAAQVVNQDCGITAARNYSSPLAVQMSRWGDVAGAFDPDTPMWLGPDGNVGITTDILAMIAKFGNHPGSPLKVRADLEPCILDFMTFAP